MTVSHILVPYDGTNDSDRAFEYAIKLCKKYSCKFSVLSCFYESSVDVLISLDDDFKNMIIKKLISLKNKSDNERVSFSHIFVESTSIVKEIVLFSSKNNVDMIIMGSTKTNAVNTIFSLDITKEVQKNAKCIVKIVK